MTRFDRAAAPFPTTRFSVLVGAHASEPKARARSWQALVAAYWMPVYQHLRLRWKKPAPEAEDLTQAFFALALEREFFAEFDDRRARFRTFLRVCLDRFVSNQNKAASRIKRGGQSPRLSLDFATAENEVSRVAADGDPETLFDREWRRSILRLCIDELRNELTARGKDSAFLLFERYDLADEHERPTYEMLAKELGLPLTTVTNQLAHARRELRRIALETLSGVTSGEDELRDEAQAFFAGSQAAR